MKKLALLCLVPLLCLTACSLLPEEEEEPFSAAFTIRPPESLTEIYFDIPMPSEQASLPGQTLPEDANTLRFEDLRSLFAQSMFGEKEDGVVSLWTEQIRYSLDGSVTDEDRQALNALAEELVQIAPFPGMRETAADAANVHIRFSDEAAPAFDCTKAPDGSITGGQILIPAALSSAQRSAMLTEKMFRLFGFFYDADTPLESVLAERSAASPTEADLILLETAYGQLKSGMTKDEALKAFSNYFLTQ